MNSVICDIVASSSRSFVCPGLRRRNFRLLALDSRTIDCLRLSFRHPSWRCCNFRLLACSGRAPHCIWTPSVHLRPCLCTFRRLATGISTIGSLSLARRCCCSFRLLAPSGSTTGWLRLYSVYPGLCTYGLRLLALLLTSFCLRCCYWKSKLSHRINHAINYSSRTAVAQYDPQCFHVVIADELQLVFQLLPIQLWGLLVDQLEQIFAQNLPVIILWPFLLALGLLSLHFFFF
mmetsp:Transcript_29886/g.75239  ORF Transcript_29886/g.75239 Transcript_29886/m.75239 type:complete len:233 (+) Transcript_29886:567-1265(+)